MAARAADRLAHDLQSGWQEYIIVAVAGGSYSGDHLAFSLPSGN